MSNIVARRALLAIFSFAALAHAPYAAAQQQSMTYVPDSRLSGLLFLQQVAAKAADCHLRGAIVFNRIFDVGQEIERGQNLDGRIAIDIGNKGVARANAAYPQDPDSGAIAASICNKLAHSRDLEQMDALYAAILADQIP